MSEKLLNIFYPKEICPYRRGCKIFRNGNCFKLEKFRECGDYKDFKKINSGIDLDEEADYVIRNLSSNKTVERTKNKELDKEKRDTFKLNLHNDFQPQCENGYNSAFIVQERIKKDINE
ncbi:MAG: hypothetical protein ACOC35_09850 [Promethearchaeia archaeon]